MITRMQQLTSDLLLLLVAFFWGATFIIVKNAVMVVDVFNFLSARLGLAFIILGLISYKHLFPIHWRTFRAGMLLGAVLFASFAFQTWGLVFIRNDFGGDSTAVLEPELGK